MRVVTYGRDGKIGGAMVISFVLATLIQIPLATIDVLFPSASSLSSFLTVNEVALGALRDDSLLAAVVFRVGGGSDTLPSGSNAMDALRADIKSGTSNALSSRLWGASTALAAKSSLYLLALPLDAVIVGGGGSSSSGGGSNADAVHLLGSIRALLSSKKHDHKNGNRRPVILTGEVGNEDSNGGITSHFMFGTVSDVRSHLSQEAEVASVELSSNLTSEILTTTGALPHPSPTSAFLCTHGLFAKYGGAHVKCN